MPNHWIFVPVWICECSNRCSKFLRKNGTRVGGFSNYIRGSEPAKTRMSRRMRTELHPLVSEASHVIPTKKWKVLAIAAIPTV
jgi:hypothetical protein